MAWVIASTRQSLKVVLQKTKVAIFSRGNPHQDCQLWELIPGLYWGSPHREQLWQLLAPGPSCDCEISFVSRIVDSVSLYIRSITEIPSKDNPSFKVLAVRSHRTNRDVRIGSAAERTGH